MRVQLHNDSAVTRHQIAAGELVLILEEGETVDDNVTEFAAQLQATGRRVGYMPHREYNGSITYRARLFVGPLPDRISDYVGPTRDLSRVSGLLAYKGMLAENCYTMSSAEPDWERLLAEVAHQFVADPATHLILNEALLHQQMERSRLMLVTAQRYLATEDWGDGRAMALTLVGDDHHVHADQEAALVCYAKAALTAPYPEAFLGLARAGDEMDASERITQAWRAADSRMDFWLWSPQYRFVDPGMRGAKLATSRQDWKQARRCLLRALAHASDGAHFELSETFSVLNRATHLRRCVRVDRAGTPVAKGLTAALMDAGHVPGRGHNLHYCFTVDPDGMPATAYFCPQTPLDNSLDTIRDVLRARGIVALSDFQQRQLQRVFPFLPARLIKRLPLGYTAAPPAKKEQLIVCGAGSDLVVAEDIFSRVLQAVPDARMVADVDAPERRLPQAKVWLYTGLDERVPLAPTELLVAQSAGAVPVCVGTGAIPEYVIRGYFYKPPATAEDFKAAAAARIVELLTNEGGRLSIARMRQWELDELQWSQVVDEWAALP